RGLGLAGAPLVRRGGRRRDRRVGGGGLARAARRARRRRQDRGRLRRPGRCSGAAAAGPRGGRGRGRAAARSGRRRAQVVARLPPPRERAMTAKPRRRFARRLAAIAVVLAIAPVVAIGMILVDVNRGALRERVEELLFAVT